MSSKGIRVRAWDQSMNTQPEHPTWNVMGMQNNSHYIVKVMISDQNLILEDMEVKSKKEEEKEKEREGKGKQDGEGKGEEKEDGEGKGEGKADGEGKQDKEKESQKDEKEKTEGEDEQQKSKESEKGEKNEKSEKAEKDEKSKENQNETRDDKKENENEEQSKGEGNEDLLQIKFIHPVAQGHNESGWMSVLSSQNKEPVKPGTEEKVPEKEFSMEEIKKHNKDDDCWIVMDNNVYNGKTILKSYISFFFFFFGSFYL